MWLASLFGQFGAGRNSTWPNRIRPRPLRRRSARLLCLERLEDRLTPSAGALDFSFGTYGKFTTDFADSSDFGYAMVLQPDGKIVVGGSTDSGGGGINFALARYLPDGTLDTSFSFDGTVATDFIGGNDQVVGVALQADGKIVAAGYTFFGGNYDFALARYNPDGTLDDSFGTHGQVTTAFASGSVFAYSVAIQADGRIVAAGRAIVGSDHDFALARYNADGTLDSNFGTSGTITTDFAGSFDVALAVALQADGKIVAAGSATVGAPEDFALVRYNPDGTLDDSFGTHGKVTTDFAGSFDGASSVVIQGDGKIVAAGSAFVGGNTDFALARYHSDGTLDANFDADGRVTTNFGIGLTTADQAFSVALQADGKIVAAGSTFADTSYADTSYFALARYNPDGTLDDSFGFRGLLTTPFLTTNQVYRSAVVSSVALQADGKFVVAGYVLPVPGDPSSTSDFALARYVGDPVQSVVINDGAAQRSMVTSITVTFSTVVTLGPGTLDHFELLRQGAGMVTLNVAGSVVNNQSRFVLTFAGTGIAGGSLADGNYTLRIRGDLIRDSQGQAIDADGDGTAGGDRLVALYRLFGDTDGDRDVDNADYNVFRGTFNKHVGDAGFLWFLDYDVDGDVDANDLRQFNQRRGSILNP